MSTRIGFFVAMGLFLGTVYSIMNSLWAIAGALIGGVIGAAAAVLLDKVFPRK